MIEQVKIDKLSSEGRGIAYTDRTCFVLGALPDEQLDIKIIKKYKGIYDAVANSAPVTSNAARVLAKCQHFLSCGACSMQHINYSYQLELKQASIKKLWHEHDYPEPNWLLPVTGPSYAYRRKARISLRFVAKKSKLLLGFKELDSRKVLDMRMCSVLTEGLQEHLFELQAILSSCPEKNVIPQVELVQGSDGVAVVIRHLAALSAASLAKLEQFALVSNWHVWLQSKGPDSLSALNSVSRFLHYFIPRYELKLAFGPLDFIQVNAQVNLQMIDLALDLLQLTSDEVVLDLFCGLGNFSLPMAKHCAKVVGIEGSKDMVIRATSNARLNNLSDKTEFYDFDLRNHPNAAGWFTRSYDKVLLDPPRSGAKTCIDWLLQKKPKTIVYISCNPESMVNDIGPLLANGYVARSVGLLDMFPQTKHAEVMACFDLKE